MVKCVLPTSSLSSNLFDMFIVPTALIHHSGKYIGVSLSNIYIHAVLLHGFVAGYYSGTTGLGYLNYIKVGQKILLMI